MAFTIPCSHEGSPSLPVSSWSRMRIPLKISLSTEGSESRIPKTCFEYQTPVTSGSAGGSGTQERVSGLQCVPGEQAGSQGGTSGGGLHTPPMHWYPNWQSPSLLQVSPPPSTQRPPLQICPSPQSPLEAQGLGPWPCTATLK